jgi:hypothetical protein
MTAITLHAQLPKGADAQKLASEIQARLAALDEVNEAVAKPESTRFAAELIAGIAITVSIIRGAGELADALHDSIPKIRRVLQDLGIVTADVEVAGELVPIDKVSRADTKKMSA